MVAQRLVCVVVESKYDERPLSKPQGSLAMLRHANACGEDEIGSGSSTRPRRIECIVLRNARKMTRTKVSLKLGIRQVTQGWMLDCLQIHSPCTRLRNLSPVTTWRSLATFGESQRPKITQRGSRSPVTRSRRGSCQCLRGPGTDIASGSFSLCTRISNHKNTVISFKILVFL